MILYSDKQKMRLFDNKQKIFCVLKNKGNVR